MQPSTSKYAYPVLFVKKKDGTMYMCLDFHTLNANTFMDWYPIPHIDDLYKGCDSCGQLLCGMLQAPSAVHTLHTHSMAAHRCSTGVCNTPVATQWLGQSLYYSLLQFIDYDYSIDIVFRYF